MSAVEGSARLDIRDFIVSFNDAFSRSDCEALTGKKLSLCLIKHHAVKTYGRVDVQIHVLPSALVGGVRFGW